MQKYINKIEISCYAPLPSCIDKLGGTWRLDAVVVISFTGTWNKNLEFWRINFFNLKNWRTFKGQNMKDV